MISGIITHEKFTIRAERLLMSYIVFFVVFFQKK